MDPDIDGRYGEDDIHIPSRFLPDDDTAFQYLVEQQADADVCITVDKLEAKNAARRRELQANRRRREEAIAPDDPDPESPESCERRRTDAFLAFCQERKAFEQTAMAEFRAIWNEQGKGGCAPLLDPPA